MVFFSGSMPISEWLGVNANYRICFFCLIMCVFGKNFMVIFIVLDCFLSRYR